MNTVIKAVAGTVGAGLSAFVLAEAVASRGNTKTTPDYLMILGTTVHGEEPCETLKARIRDAGNYLLAHPSVTAIPCGGIVHEDQTKAEAVVIAEGLEKMGIESSRIIIEDKSTTTVENFVNAKNIIESLGKSDATLAFISSEYHLFRAGIIAKLSGVKVTTLPSATPPRDLPKAYVREFMVMSSILKALPKK